jgi:hypothetical protein
MAILQKKGFTETVERLCDRTVKTLSTYAALQHSPKYTGLGGQCKPFLLRRNKNVALQQKTTKTWFGLRHPVSARVGFF